MRQTLTDTVRIADRKSVAGLRPLRVVSGLLLGVLSGILIGCGGDVPSGGNDDMSGPLPAADLAASPPTFSWLGTWNAAVSYTASCTFGGGQPNTATQNHTNPIVVASNGSGGLKGHLEPTYSLTGTGDADGLTLSGQYPLRDFQGKTAGTLLSNPNMITITIESVVSDKKVTGKIAGTYETVYSCTAKNGTITMTR